MPYAHGMFGPSEHTRTGLMVKALGVSHLRASLALVALALLLFLPGQFTLQPMDRDEPRFSQATKQMLETRDFIDIRFQDEARHKKPVGIYWLQSVAVSAAEALGAADARRTVGYYRLPSLLAAILATLLTYWSALALLSRTGAFLAAALMAATVLLGVEARLAKTDAMLLVTCLVGFGVLARLWLRHQSPRTEPETPRWQSIVFWGAMGIGILVKGPITPLIVGLPMLVLSVRSRSGAWLRPLRPVMGIVIVALIAAPWLLAIAWKSGGAFFGASIGEDMLTKVGQSPERHWGPPGLYALIFWATAWPMAVFAALALRFAWVERKDAAVSFLLAWIVPTWLLFEAFMTKLPHYVMPLYPSIAILSILALERDGVPFHWRSARYGAAPLALLVPVLLLVGAPVAFWSLDRTLPFFALPLLLLGAVLSWMAMRALHRSDAIRAAVLLIVSMLPISVAAYNFGLPKLEAINITERLVAAARSVPCADPRYATAGYNEPSLVLRTSTQIALVDGAKAAALFERSGCTIAFVDQRHEQAFQSALAPIADKPSIRTRVQGININSGRKLDIGVYVRER